MLPSRIRHRVLAGGHDVPTSDVMRRYERSLGNVKDYAALADVLYVFDASHLQQEMIYRRNGGEQVIDPRRVPLMRKVLGL
jgi:predicted ABC-type ATPase